MYLHKKEQQEDDEAPKEEEDEEEDEERSKSSPNPEGKGTKTEEKGQELDGNDNNHQEPKKPDEEGAPEEKEPEGTRKGKDVVQDKPPKEKLNWWRYFVHTPSPQEKPRGLAAGAMQDASDSMTWCS